MAAAGGMTPRQSIVEVEVKDDGTSDAIYAPI
jgi:hypothetical protein